MLRKHRWSAFLFFFYHKEVRGDAHGKYENRKLMSPQWQLIFRFCSQEAFFQHEGSWWYPHWDICSGKPMKVQLKSQTHVKQTALTGFQNSGGAFCLVLKKGQIDLANKRMIIFIQTFAGLECFFVLVNGIVFVCQNSAFDFNLWSQTVVLQLSGWRWRARSFNSLILKV